MINYFVNNHGPIGKTAQLLFKSKITLWQLSCPLFEKGSLAEYERVY
jgi:hypothetical protein